MAFSVQRQDVVLCLLMCASRLALRCSSIFYLHASALPSKVSLVMRRRTQAEFFQRRMLIWSRFIFHDFADSAFLRTGQVQFTGRSPDVTELRARCIICFASAGVAAAGVCGMPSQVIAPRNRVARRYKASRNIWSILPLFTLLSLRSAKATRRLTLPTLASINRIVQKQQQKHFSANTEKENSMAAMREYTNTMILQTRRTRIHW